MKASYVLTIILTSCIVSTYERKSIGKLTNLGAVTSFEGIENFYQILRQEKSESPPQESKQPEKNANIRKTICQNIFTSNYFVDVHRVDWFDVDFKENRIELKSAYPDLFQFIYRERKTLCLSLSFASDRSCYSYKYENNYKLLPVSAGEFAGEEYLFMCVARDRQSMKIKPYFVSQEYNVNSFLDNYPMAGRFIFGYDDVHKDGTRTNRLKMLAMAEESAVGWDFLGRFIEMYYISERSKDKLRRSPGSRRKISDRTAARVNLRDSEVRNRSLSLDVNKSTTTSPIISLGHDDERADVTMMPSFTDSEMYASDPRDRMYSYDRVDANQQSWLGNGGETLDNANDVWKNDVKNTPNVDKPLSTMSRVPSLAPGLVPGNTDLASRLRNGFYDNKDPICQLTTGEKLRLCATIFASSVFRGKVKFVPTTENVQLECEKKQISLVAEVAAPPPLLARITQWELRENGKESYEESMIGCRAITKDKNYKMTYLVSRGNYDNSVFVYTHKFADRRVFVYNYFNNTSVI